MPSAPTKSDDVGDARAARSALAMEARRAAGSWEKAGSDGSRARWRDSWMNGYAPPITTPAAMNDPIRNAARTLLGARCSGLGTRSVGAPARRDLARRATISPQHHT